MPAYETLGYEVPAPVARAWIIGPEGATIAISLLIDSGADVSVVPRWAADAVGANTVTRTIELEAYDGAISNGSVRTLRLEFLHHAFEGLFVVTEMEDGVLGRNILNTLALTLDGPRRFWTTS
jgi:hypothetical protein